MSLFGKIKSAVRGNPVTRDYELGRHVASAGPGLLWKVHSGVKKTSKQEVSIFVFDKKAPEFEKLPKKQKEQIFDMLKKGPTQLIKLRHPRLLMVDHQVEESSETLAFVTEPIFASLANLLGHYDNVPSPLPLVIKEHQLHPIEVQYGLLQVAEALSFLHTGVKMIHGNLSPSNVVVTSKGAWKLLGFNFCCFSQYQTDAQKSFAFKEWNTQSPVYTNPSLDYLAPEYILSKSCDTPSDIYSLGMLTYAIYNGGRPIFESNNNMLAFKQNVEQISRISEASLGRVPDEVKGLIRTTLAVEPTVRPDALEISKHAFFEEVAVSTLKYLDTLFEKKDMDKSQFFKKSLARVITKLPKRMVHQHVLPPLSEEFRNHKMIPFVLPLVLLVAEDCTLTEYSELIMPILTPAMNIQEPIQIPLIFLQKMDLILKMTPQDAILRHVLPMIVKSLEAENSQVQELCVSILPSFASMVDYSSMKHTIVPRITVLCLSAKVHTLQVKCLVCLGQLLDILDKHIVLDQILPTLHQIRSREPGVLMAMLGIFHQTLTNPKLGLDKKILAQTVIPFLLPIAIEPSLNVKQFKQFIRVIRDMLSKVESEQESHLQQMEKMEEQTKSTVEFAREVAETKTMDDALNRLEGMITGVDPKEESVTAKRGDISVMAPSSLSPMVQPMNSGNSNSSSTGQSSSANSNFLSGFNLAELSSTFSRNSTFPISSAAPTQASATPTLLSTTPSTQATPPISHKSEPLQPMTHGSSSTSSSYMAPPLIPTQKDQQVQGGGMDLLSGSLKSDSTLSSGGTSGWSSGLLGSSTQSNPTQSSSQTTKSIFSGLESGGGSGLGRGSNSPAMSNKGSNAGIFGGMNVGQSSPLSASKGRGMSGQQQQRTNSSGLGGGGSGGLAQPLIPVGYTGSSSGTGSTGWSSSIQPETQQQDLLGGMMGSNNSPLQPRTSNTNTGNASTGWSSSIGGNSGSRNTTTGSGMGWSQTIGGNPTGIGTNQSGMGTNIAGMEINQTGMGMNRSNTGMSQSGIGMNQSGMNMSNTGMNQSNMAMNQSGMGMNQSGMGMNQSGMGINQSGMGINQSGMGINQSGMGMNQSGMGVNQSGMAMNNGLGAGQTNNSSNGWSSTLQPSRGATLSNPNYGQSQQQSTMGMGRQGNYGQQPMQPTGQLNYGGGQVMQPTVKETQSNSMYMQPMPPNQGGGVASGWGQGQHQQQPQQQQVQQQSIAPGANPFADLNFQC